MAVQEMMKDRADDLKDARNRWIGVYIAFLATLLAIASMGGNNADKDAAKANLDATNNWAFFQAKNLRRQHYIMAKERLELQLIERPDMSAELRQAIEKKLEEYKGRIAHFTSDKKRMEGLDELWHRGKRLEAIRDAMLKRTPYFDYGQAFIQIAIVLASVAIITGGTGALLFSALIGMAGVICSLNGFAMFVDFMPYIESLFGGTASAKAQSAA